MSWFRVSSQQSDPLNLQRDTSPPLALCGLSQTSQGSASRVFGSDITNRSPTPPPQPLARVVSNGCQGTDDEVCDSLLLSSCALPSHQVFVDALTGEQGKGVPTAPLRRRRSRSPSHRRTPDSRRQFYTSAVATLNERSDEQERLLPFISRSRTAAAASDGPSIAKGGESHDRQPIKRRRAQGCDMKTSDHACVLRQHQPSALTCANDADTASHVEEEEGYTGICAHRSAFFTPISTNLLLSSATFAKRGGSTAAAAEVVQHVAQTAGCTSPRRSPMPVPVHGCADGDYRHAQDLCWPAGVVDCESPSWLVVAAAVEEGGHRAWQSGISRGSDRLRVVNAADHSIVHSPSSLEDVSPILDVSESRVLGQRHLEDEEGVDGCMSASPLFTPQQRKDEESTDADTAVVRCDPESASQALVSESAPVLRRGVLETLSATMLDTHSSLLAWQK